MNESMPISNIRLRHSACRPATRKPCTQQRCLQLFRYFGAIAAVQQAFEILGGAVSSGGFLALFPYRSGVDGRLHISGTVLCRVRADMLDILQQLSLSDLAAKLYTNSLRAAYLHRPVACTYRTRDAPDVLSSSRFSSKAIPEASRIKSRRSVIPRPEFAGVMLRNRRSEIPPTTNTTSVCTRYRRVLPENLSYLRQILRPASTMCCSV